MELPWDPEIDTPATIAILGGGPIGIEAALYARFLGYSVQVIEQERVGKLLCRWGDLAMPAPFGQTASPLGLAALEAQESPCQLSLEATCSYNEYIDQYLIPVAKTDLIYDSICIQSAVRSISRLGVTPETRESLDDRSQREFRILVDSRQRGEYSQIVDIVLDCTGLGTLRRGMASGGSLACGQVAAEANLLTGKRDVLGSDRDTFSGQHTVLIGDDLEACLNVADFEKLCQQDASTKLTWLVPKDAITNGPAAASRYVDATTAFGDGVQQASEALARRELPIVPLGVWGIERITREESGWKIDVQPETDETLQIACDQLIDCSRGEPDFRFTGGISINAGIETAAGEPETRIITGEPHYYVLGSKACSGQPLPEIAAGLQHIRRAFGHIGGRAELDLYSTVKPQGS